MKSKLLTTLALILPILSGCAGKVSVTNHDWCLNDRWICASHQDTPATQDQVTDHNAGYGAACPKQPHVCK